MDSTNDRPWLNCHFSFIDDSFPPPYKYRMEGCVDLRTGEFDIRKTFIDRELCSKEELEEAKYFETDKNEWKGRLSGNWINYLITIPEKYSKVNISNGFFTFNKSVGTSETFAPDNLKLSTIIHAMIQAELEQTGVELPLQLRIYLPATKQICTLTCVFASLNAWVTTPDSKELNIDWEAAMDFIQTFFMSDFDEWASHARQPVNGKCCISLHNEDGWLYVDDETARRKAFPDFELLFNNLLCGQK